MPLLAANALPNTPRFCHLETVSDESPNNSWPWMLMVVFLFSWLLAALWMLPEVQSIRQIRNLNNPPSTQTHPPSIRWRSLQRAKPMSVKEKRGDKQSLGGCPGANLSTGGCCGSKRRVILAARRFLFRSPQTQRIRTTC